MPHAAFFAFLVLALSHVFWLKAAPAGRGAASGTSRAAEQDDGESTHGSIVQPLGGRFAPKTFRPNSAGVRLAVLAHARSRRQSHMEHTVLIVDDHPAFRRTARLLLEAEGFDVLGEAADGASAVEAAKRLSPQLVLLDVQLPDIDGFEVAPQITNGGGGPAVVMCSSHDGSDFGVARRDAAAHAGSLPRASSAASDCGSCSCDRPSADADRHSGSRSRRRRRGRRDHERGQRRAAVRALAGRRLGIHRRRASTTGGGGPTFASASCSCLTGFAMILSLLAVAHSDIYIVGELLGPLPIILLIHVLLAFPTGRVEGRLPRFLVGLAYFDGVLQQVLYILSWNPDFTDDGDHPNPLLLIHSRTFFDVVTITQTVIGVFGMAGIAVVLIGRYRSAALPTKRILKPVFIAGVLTLGHALRLAPGRRVRLPRRHARGHHRRARDDGARRRAARLRRRAGARAAGPGRRGERPDAHRQRRRRPARAARRRARRPDARARLLAARG